MNQPWPVAATPEEAGLSSRGLLNYLDAVQASHLEHHSIMIMRHGKLALTLNWKPYDINRPHMLFSLSKSFCSAAAGFAVKEGLLKWDTPVLEVLSEHAPENPSEWLRQVTLLHLLMMGSGLREESDTTDTVAETLAYDCDHAPGTHFHYNSHGTFLVSAMVQKVTGQTVRDYLIPRLFEPLGIPTPHWQTNKEGISWGGWGLKISTESILRFGSCLLNDGKWQGKQVLPEGWVEFATKSHIDNSNGHPEENNEWAQGYGLQFWRTRGDRYRGDGAFGQICMVSKKLDMVVAITAGIEDMGAEMQLLHQYLFPAADMEPGSADEQRLLMERAAKLEYAQPENSAPQQLTNGIYKSENVTITIEDQPDGTKTLQWEYQENDRKEDMMLPITPGKAFETVLNPEEPSGDHIHCSITSGWVGGALHLFIRCPDAPFTLKMRLTPQTDGLLLAMDGVGFPKLEQLLLPA